MIKLERFEVMNFENAMRGARNPLNSWARMDSKTENGVFTFGPNDLDLAKRLCKAGSDHRKFIRQIFVTVDITAPIYWWKEYDTYKVGTVANSTSTMHKIHSKSFEMEDFSVDHCTSEALDMMQKNIDFLETIRQKFIETKDKDLWYSIIRCVPAHLIMKILQECIIQEETISLQNGIHSVTGHLSYHISKNFWFRNKEDREVSYE